MDDSRTHLLFIAPLKSCIAMMAKTIVVTRHRKQILAIEGINLVKVWIRCCISGNDVNVRSVRSARIPRNADTLIW